MTIVRTIKDGPTEVDRAILRSSAPTAAPTTADRGFHFQGSDFLHVYVDTDGGVTATSVSPWFFSSIANLWFRGDVLNFSTVNRFAIVEVRGEERVFFSIDTITGAGQVRLWAGHSYQEPGRE